MATTRDVLAMLSELVTLTTIDEGSPQSFKTRAYENARLGIEADGRDVTELSVTELTKIKGVGKATATKVRELVDTGTVAKLEALRATYPPPFVELSRVPGVGPKTLHLLRDHLGIADVEGLKAAIDAEQLRTLPGLGETTERKIAKAIERLGLSGKDRRTPIADALPLARRLVADLADLPAVADVAYCGSLRRMSETIGDIDITVASDEPAAVTAAVVAHGEVSEVVLSGDTKTSFLTHKGLQVDVRVVAPAQFGAATLYFTGSKAHNVALRQRALARGMLLNEYGLFDVGDEDVAVEDRPVVASRTEEEIYDALGMAYVAPPLREATGEVEAAAASPTGEGPGLPDLIRLEHVRGDLHYHTDRSGDGRSSVADMVQVAADRGYEYLAITDHGVDLAINGSTAAEMLEHRDVIRRVQDDHPDMQVLWGCELNIGAKGGLDYDPDFRASFEYTVASVHSHFDLPQRDQTKRLIAAISDPTVTSIGHLTGRYIGRRPGIELDIDVVIEALHHFDVALEVNGALDRLDAASDVVRKAVDRGVKLVINTDSHHTSELGRMEYGVLTAQRGWCPHDQVVNTWPREQFLEWIAARTARTPA
ncbi:MAG TPA: DNA polymerase/3'-5' exonuclease PolX [Acidimicrobiia bacterium]|nr:DNA polymerase/3'-5' exonuclease PolX [Acidimicrobiia bacterium]